MVEEGDENTHFFRTIATIGRQRNKIESLIVNGNRIEDSPGIKEAEVSFFKGILNEKLSRALTLEL